MPELPEVETVRRGLAANLTGRTVTAVIVRRKQLRDPLPKNLKTAILQRTITGVRRRAKYLLFDIPPKIMLAHLGMSGAFSFDNDAPTAKHAHLAVGLDDGRFLVYTDPRRFGRITLTDDDTTHPWLCDLGPEPLLPRFRGASLQQALKGRKTPIKTALMNSRLIAGIGNIYASEALFLARIHPQTAAGKINTEQCQTLTKNIKFVLQKALRAGGSTLRNFSDTRGKPGYFQTQWAVYNRAGLPCLNCKMPIKRIVQSGRASYYCPHCQR